MSQTEYTEENLSEIREDAFVNIKEACMRLQERTKCENEVVIKMLNEVSQFYISQNDKNKTQVPNTYLVLSNSYIFNTSGFIKLVFLSFNKLISSTDPSTLIRLFISPVKVISPPVELAKMVVGLNNFNN